jgi:hypothetical protein
MNTAIRSMITRTAVAGVTLTGAAALVLGSSGIAGATINTNPFPGQYAQPPYASTVYQIQATSTATSGSTLLLEDNGNAMTNGSTVDVWDKWIYDNAGSSAGSGAITQADEQWEFQPASSNPWGSISTGWGELINRQSGLCLDINGSNQAEESSDGAIVDQWQCVDGAANEEWKAVSTTGGWQLVSQLDGDVLGTDEPNCSAQDGDVVDVVSDPSPCSTWSITRASYEFATNQWGVEWGGLTEYDTQTYSCINGYNMRLNPNSKTNTQNGGGIDGDNYYAYTNLSDSGVSVSEDTSGGENGGQAQPEYYQLSTHDNLNGQIALYCDPASYTSL